MNQIGKLFPKADERFTQIISEMLEIHSRKIQDYGPIDAPDGNLTASQELGIPPHVGVLLRMNDKMRRLKHFIKEGTLVNESFEDSLLDLANYSLLCLILYREHLNASNKESAKALLTLPKTPTIDLSDSGIALMRVCTCCGKQIGHLYTTTCPYCHCVDPAYDPKEYE